MGLGCPRASLETVDKTEIPASFWNLTQVSWSFSLQGSQIEVIRDLNAYYEFTVLDLNW